MITVLILCTLWGIGLLFLISFPYFFSQRESEDVTVAEDDGEILAFLRIRDLLMLKLLGNNPKELEEFSEEDALESLVDVCIRLKELELPYLPNKNTLNLLQKSFRQIVMLFFVGALSFSYSVKNYAESHPVTSGIAFPPPATLTTSKGEVHKEIFQPSVHQFFLTPMQGEVGVHYIGMFGWPIGVDKVTVVLPLPRFSYQFQFIESNHEPVWKKSVEGLPTMTFTKKDQPRPVEIKANFILPATFGHLTIEPAFEKQTLPGTAVFLLEELPEGPLKKITSDLPLLFSVWPARITSFPRSFVSQLQVLPQEQFKKANPKTKDMDKRFDHSSAIRQIVRYSNGVTDFPTLTVLGIIPARILLYLLAAGFFMTFLTISFAYLYKARKN